MAGLLMRPDAKAPSAAELVNLAERAANACLGTAKNPGAAVRWAFDGGKTLYVNEQCWWGTKRENFAEFMGGSNIVLSAPLTPENVASPLALKRALLASAVEAGQDDEQQWRAILGGFYIEDPYGSPTRESAITAVLDTLLGSAQ